MILDAILKAIAQTGADIFDPLMPTVNPVFTNLSGNLTSALTVLLPYLNDANAFFPVDQTFIVVTAVLGYRAAATGWYAMTFLMRWR